MLLVESLQVTQCKLSKFLNTKNTFPFIVGSQTYPFYCFLNLLKMLLFYSRYVPPYTVYYFLEAAKWLLGRVRSNYRDIGFSKKVKKE